MCVVADYFMLLSKKIPSHATATLYVSEPGSNSNENFRDLLDSFSTMSLLTWRLWMLCADKQPCKFMVHFTIYFHFRHGNFGNEVVRSGNRRMVEERAVLGDRRRVSSLVCGFPRALEGVCRH